MGSYTFKWEHPADEVYVTGTFDNWTKSVQLEKQGDVFEKTVNLEIPSDKIYYKFVVDNNWTTNESSPKEADKEGNVNNFISSEVLAASAISSSAINTVAPGSTTAAMAGQQTLEKDKLVGINPLPASETGINPISLQPGEKVPQDLAAGDINKHVKLDKESYEKSDSLVGIPNPADIPPIGATTIPESGLPMGQNATINTVAPGATTAALAGQVPLEPKAVESTSGAEDKKKKKKNKKKNEKKKQKKAAAANGSANDNNDESNSDEADHSTTATAAAVGGGAAAVAAAIAAGSAAVASKASEQAAPTVDATQAAATEAINKNLPDAAKEKLPEQVKEIFTQQETAKEVPAEVKESIKEAGESPEAAANSTAVEEKKAVEAELLHEVKPAAVAAPEEAVKPVEIPAEKPIEKPVEESKPAETPKAPSLAAAAVAAPVVAAVVGQSAQPVENGAAKTADVSVPKPAEPKPTETKIVVSEPVILSPVAQAAESKPADVSAPATIEAQVSEAAEVPKPAETTPVVSQPVEAEPAETKAVEAEPAESTPAETNPTEVKPAEQATTAQPSTTTEPAANGSSSKPAAVTGTDKTSDASAVDKKKKSRLSTIFSKLKHKLSDKN